MKLNTATLCLILATSIAAAATTPRVWTSKANATNTVTARLVGYKDGVLKLRDSDRVFTVREIDLTDADRAYILANCNPYVGLTPEQCDGITERQAPAVQAAADAADSAAARTAEWAVRRHRLLELQDQRNAELAACIGANPRVGDTGHLYRRRARILQILGPDLAMISYRWADTERTCFLSGLGTAGLADDTDITLTNRLIVASTRSYETAGGSFRTLYVLQPVSAAPSK